MEFFEKRKMQQKLKNLGMALPASPKGTSAGSMDLVTLFIVNQIASKKEITDPPKVAVLGSYKGGSKHKRNELLVLPMSPGSPSQLSLVEGQPEYSVQGTRKRKYVIPQGFKCRQLSPVLESAYSDNSASDYLPPITNPLSPFSTSSASSGQGLFPLQMNLQQRRQTQLPHCSPPPWDTSGLKQTKFQPFCLPRVMADSISWSCGSKPPLYQLKTPTAAEVLFRSPKPDNTEAMDQARRDVSFSLNQPEGEETEQQFEGEVFRGFSTEECEEEAAHYGRGPSKIYLKDETPAESSQTVPDSQCMEVEDSDFIRFSNCTDMNFCKFLKHLQLSLPFIVYMLEKRQYIEKVFFFLTPAACLEHNNVLMNGCEYSPSYSCRRGYLSSDSDDEEECCQPYLQASSSYMDPACCAESLNPNPVSQGNPEQRHIKPRPLTPLLKPQSFRDKQTLMDNTFPPVLSPQAQCSEMCTCQKKANETRDAGTQTAAVTCDAETQCSAVEDGATAEFNWCVPPVDVSVQHPPTGRQTDAAAERTHTASTGKATSGEKLTPWVKKKPKAGSLSGSSIINNIDGKVILQKHFLDALSVTDGRGKGGDEGERQENGRLVKDLSNESREEVTSASRANRLSEEAETLQEIADILLLLRQRKKVM
ncbi:uncharacterized protein LOC117483327 isoform X2 [Trematomus bernacchii]|uniref:uncharacterized protein LOC117483327 isoform X2 n=1 Tax=Trematomus bernacchii TaxID=40690 RepID=UPI00146B5B1A|nr:uncharacterized protein LOC117483327 isoform X2 [Trematomus bernacchii]